MHGLRGGRHAVMTPTGLSPLGVVARPRVGGGGLVRRDVRGRGRRPGVGRSTAPSACARPTRSSRVVAEYHDGCARSRAIADAAPMARRPERRRGSTCLGQRLGSVDLRAHDRGAPQWHAGHLDLMREQIDGRDRRLRTVSGRQRRRRDTRSGGEPHASSDHGPSSPCVDTAVTTKQRGPGAVPVLGHGQ